MRRVVSLGAALLASACCSSLPPLPPKKLAFQPPASGGAVDVSRDIWRDERRNGREVPVTLYVPSGRTAALPVVVLSHGIGEDRDSYEYLGRALAAHGFMTVHLTHAGTDRAVLDRGYLHLWRAVRKPENWRNRPLDVSFVLDRLAGDPRADLRRVAAAGHSAGAFTSFALSGMRTADGERLRDERIKAAVPISMPRLDGVVPAGGYDDVTVPVLNITGTCDTSIVYRTWPKHRRIPFQAAPAGNQYLVTLDGVNHDTFSSPADSRHPFIAELVALFLRGFLLNDSRARSWFEEPGRTSIAGTELAVERK